MRNDVVEVWRKHTWYFLDRTKTKLLASCSKSRIHDGFSWTHKEKKKLESTRERIWQQFMFIDNNLIYLITATKYINTEKKPLKTLIHTNYAIRWQNTEIYPKCKIEWNAEL